MKSVTTMVLALTAVLAISGCGDKKGNPPDDEGGEAQQKASACDISSFDSSFADCAREVLVNSGLLPEEKEDLMGCKFEAAQSRGTPVDQFEAAKQAVKRTCE